MAKCASQGNQYLFSFLFNKKNECLERSFTQLKKNLIFEKLKKYPFLNYRIIILFYQSFCQAFHSTMAEPRTSEQQGFLAAELQQQSNIGSITKIYKMLSIRLGLS